MPRVRAEHQLLNYFSELISWADYKRYNHIYSESDYRCRVSPPQMPVPLKYI